ncbi:MAG: CopG family transcriptional regulator [Nocardioides sp.]
MALTLRTDPELDEALNALAASQGLSKQEVLRRAVLDWHERTNHRDRVGESSQRMLAEWGDVLERLGSV